MTYEVILTIPDAEFINKSVISALFLPYTNISSLLNLKTIQ